MQFSESIKELLDHSFFDISFSKLTLAAAIMIFFLILMKLSLKIIEKVFSKLSAVSPAGIDEQLVSALEMSIRLFFITFGFWISIMVLELPDNIITVITRAVRSILAFLIFWVAYRAVDTLCTFLQKLTQRSKAKIDNILLVFMKNSFRILIIIFGTIVIVQEWGYDVGAIVAGLGLGGLAFALAAKDTAANLFGGIMIMTDRPFMIGDWIMTPHVEGTVEEIGFRSTRVRTFAQALVTIPNSMMSNEPITNWSRMGKRRINFRLRVNFDASPQQIRECTAMLKQMLISHPELEQDTIMVYFEGFGDSALEIFICVFTKTTEYQKFVQAKEDINLKILDILSEAQLSMALPTRSVYMCDPKIKN